MGKVRKEVLAEGVEIYCGDCCEIMTSLKSIDACITDPPYGIGINYGSFIDTQENVIKLAKAWLPLATACSSRVIFTPENINQHSYPRPDWTMAWITPAGAGSGPWGFSCWQPIMCYGKDPLLASGKGRAHDIIMHTESSESNSHPCPKPIIFMQRLLLRCSLEGETILDPFMGSGTTGVAAIESGRKFIGIEIEPKYYDIARRRIVKALAQPLLFVSKPKVKQEKLFK